MTSSNINKIVQSNLNLKPWVLSKNTNEIINSCIQKMYKQMPTNFRKGFISPKVAAPRPENQGPIRTYKNQERQLHIAALTPVKKPSKSNNISAVRPNDRNLVNNFKASNRNNMQMSNKFAAATLKPSKKSLKSPNYKIYKSSRFGSSSSTSRSSLFRRYDEQRRQRQHFQPQVNYLVRSFHSSQFEGTYARHLMPLRNQQVETRLGSVAQAKRISTDIQNDLIKIEDHTLGRLSMVGNKMNAKKAVDRLDVWKHPPPINTSIYRKAQYTDYVAKKNSCLDTKRNRQTPEHRDNVRITASRISQLQHSMPSNDLFTAKHERYRTELQEKHRRNRMKKLGLIEQSPREEAQQVQQSAGANAVAEIIKQSKWTPKWTPNIQSHMEANAVIETTAAKYQPKLAINNKSQTINSRQLQLCNQLPQPSSGLDLTKKGFKSMASPTNTKADLTENEFESSAELCKPTAALPNCYTSIGPTAATRAQVKNLTNYYRAYRNNRDDFFSTKKY